jgi:hypothetical protein
MSDPEPVDCCEFNWPEPDGEDSWHYTRTCTHCGTTWGALHCTHDGAQNPCPHCGHIPGSTFTPEAILFPEDREFLERHGWRDTSGNYPTIGTERTWT